MNKMETCADGRVCEAIQQYSDPCIVYFCDLCFWATPNCPYDIEPPSAECQVAFCKKGPTPSDHGWKLPFIVVIVLLSFFALALFCGWKYRQLIFELLQRSRNGDREPLNNDDMDEQLSEQSRLSSELSEVEREEQEQQQQTQQHQQDDYEQQQQQQQHQQQQQQQQHQEQEQLYNNQHEQGAGQNEPAQSRRHGWMRRIRPLRIWRRSVATEDERQPLLGWASFTRRAEQAGRNSIRMNWLGRLEEVQNETRAVRNESYVLPEYRQNQASSITNENYGIA